MIVKIDTKEKFTIITPNESALTAILTDELINTLLPYLQTDIPHIIISMEQVKTIDESAAYNLANIQQKFYESNCSLVICCLQKPVEVHLEKLDLLEVMNITPTESEAWDIVQMEEIEREILNDGE